MSHEVLKVMIANYIYCLFPLMPNSKLILDMHHMWSMNSRNAFQSGKTAPHSIRSVISSNSPIVSSIAIPTVMHLIEDHKVELGKIKDIGDAVASWSL
jgi:hypothetical protein